ncbi:hypothetical protein CCACVL1_24592, partial [Corchorus capsularis]
EIWSILKPNVLKHCMETAAWQANAKLTVRTDVEQMV